MNTKSETRDFLMSRRARLTPADVGLPSGNRRRVPGLRREEVAMLAGVSIDYYIQLERGEIAGVSDSVLDAVAQTLRLDDAECEHLRDLVRASNGSKRRSATPKALHPSVQRFLNAITDAPAWIQNGRLDVLATNSLGYALYSEMFEGAIGTVNAARFAFLNPRAQSFYVDWSRTADEFVAVLRAEAGRNPHDKALIELLGELATRSDSFRQRWAAHDVRVHGRGVKRINHPGVGELELTYESMTFVANPGLTLSSYSAEPATRSAESIQLLASWAATTGAAAWPNRQTVAVTRPELSELSGKSGQ